MRKTLTILLILIFSIELYAQTGGTSTYQFLTLPVSGRIASLGGKMITAPGSDLNLTFSNPSLLSKEMNNELVLNYSGYFANIHYGYAAYSHSFDKLGNFAVGIHFIDYGEFIAADQTGIITGKFQAAEHAFHLTWSIPIDSTISVGVSLKPVLSTFERYRSMGIVADFGVSYISRNQLFAASFTINNLGRQISTYYGGNHEPLPFEVQLAISNKLEHAPFRLFLTAHSLQHYDLLPPEENTYSNNGYNNSGKESSGIEIFGDNLMRHMVMGLEFIPFENFALRFGYNYQRRQELKIPARISTVGFSWGFGLKISQFRLNYGRATYHLAGASNHFSFSTNMGNLYQKVFN
ncbi:MAG: type IX secretion system protein PorQ [Bacteroidales bacterium]|nr:type IX secretion system protein PorQ [Bacteroidales bacterium]